MTVWGKVIQFNGDRRVGALDLCPEYRDILTELARNYRWPYDRLPLYRSTYVNGSFVAFSWAAFDVVGGFDERFLLYYEETELSRGLLARFGLPQRCRSIKVLHEGRGIQPSSEFMMREERLQYGYRRQAHWPARAGSTKLASRRLRSPIGLRIADHEASIRDGNQVW